jgi:hypothetical protein
MLNLNHKNLTVWKESNVIKDDIKIIVNLLNMNFSSSFYHFTFAVSRCTQLCNATGNINFRITYRKR